MARTWVMMIGLTLLWAATCPGDVAFIGPPEQAGDGGNPGATEGSGTVEPIPGPGYEVGGGYEVKPDPGYDIIVSEPGSTGEGEVIDVKPQGDGEVVYVKPDPGEVVISPGPLERDNRIYTMSPTNESEGTSSPLDAGTMLVGMAPQNGYASVLAQIPDDVLATLGLSTGTGGEGAGPGPFDPVNTGDAPPDLTQVKSTIGLVLAEHVGTLANVMSNLPNFTGQFDNRASQMSGHVIEVFSGIQMPGVASLLLPGQ
jgi:hypothetical protein